MDPAVRSLDEAELLRLWQRGREMALRRCARTLARLRLGAGGFYEAEDFLQDLFLEFWALARRWRATGQGEEALWAAWERALSRGGKQILRRRPQRLWEGREWPVEPTSFALDEDPTDEEVRRAALPEEALTEQASPEAVQGRTWRLEALAQALWSLRPVQRQVLYLAAVAELPAAALARALGLAEANTAHQRVWAARQALKQRMKEEG